MNSTDSSGNATYLGCFSRSLMFRTISTLSETDSGMLYLKSVGMYYIVTLVVVIVASLLGGHLSTKLVLGLIAHFLVFMLVFTVSVFVISFISNLFLANSFFRVVNIFVFSLAYSQLFNIMMIAMSAYSSNLYETFRTLYGLKSPAGKGIAPPSQGSSASGTGMPASLYILASIFGILALVAFVVLLVRNIRALRNK